MHLRGFFAARARGKRSPRRNRSGRRTTSRSETSTHDVVSDRYADKQGRISECEPSASEAKQDERRPSEMDPEGSLS